MSSLGPTYKAVQSQTQQVAPQEVPLAINALTSSPAPDSQFPQAAGRVESQGNTEPASMCYSSG